MGREIRRVPADWEHPRDETGGLIPLYDQDFPTAAAEWKEGYRRWESGEVENHGADRDVLPWRPRDMSASWEDASVEFWEYDGPPDRDSYRKRAWTPEQASHYQMYETVSEGTPVSPVFATPEEVARWCADNLGGWQKASYEAWLRVARGGYAPSAVFTSAGVQNGVEGMTPHQEVNENP
jgi:hypothetical protein